MAHHSHGTAGSIEPHVICATCARNAKKYPHRFYSQAKGRGREGARAWYPSLWRWGLGLLIAGFLIQAAGYIVALVK